MVENQLAPVSGDTLNSYSTLALNLHIISNKIYSIRFSWTKNIQFPIYWFSSNIKNPHE